MCLQVHFHRGLIFFPHYPRPSVPLTVGSGHITAQRASLTPVGSHTWQPHTTCHDLFLWGSQHRTRVLSGQGFCFIIPTAVKPLEDPCSVLLSLAPGAWPCDEELHPQLSERASLSPTHQPHLSPKQSEQSPHLCPQSTRFVPPAEHLC